MTLFEEVKKNKVGYYNVSLFKFDVDSNAKVEKLKAILIEKIKKSKIHKPNTFDIEMYCPEIINDVFLKKMQDKIKDITTPSVSRVPQFDVRRERITEWMAQLLLQEKFNCTFYDEADKRICMDFVDIDKHTSGIDVPGILYENNCIKFVICEVKASSDEKIPAKEVMKSLQKDIQKSIDNENNRVTKEILNYVDKLKDSKSAELVKNVIKMLLKLISGDENLNNNIAFFPLVIRNNTRIITENNLNDFKEFTLNSVKSDTIKNIILSFCDSIEDFSKQVYEEALL